jgi:hypothetical protein
MNPDGISYLDMADAYLRGDFRTAINSVWSPFYSWLLGLSMLVLKPSAYWEFAIVHLTNFIIYLFALGCFHFFLIELVRYQQDRIAQPSGDRSVTFPRWALLSLGYSFFIWSSFNLITLSVVTPDMCVAAFLYLASGIILRIRRGSMSWPMFVFLGLALGFGYLAKTVMFPLAFVFFAVTLFFPSNVRRAVPHALLALVVFFSVAGPFIFALSQAKGRFTFGESGRLNYAYAVNRVPYSHWQGANPGSGIPQHPTKKIFEKPPIYEFGNPVGGTYPISYDPYYWYEGVVPHFDLKGQLRVLFTSAKAYYDLFFLSQGGLLFGFLTLYLWGYKTSFSKKNLAEQAILFVPAIAGLGIYSFILVLPRYIGGLVTLLWMALASTVRLPDSQESRRLATLVVALMLAIVWIKIGASTLPAAYSTGLDTLRGEDASAHVHWQVAKALSRLGVQPGDKVANIGHSYVAFWARLAQVQIVAEIPKFPRGSEHYFWAADPSVKSQIIETFKSTGAKAIVTDSVPAYASRAGWQKVESTDYYVFVLPKSK